MHIRERIHRQFQYTMCMYICTCVCVYVHVLCRYLLVIHMGYVRMHMIYSNNNNNNSNAEVEPFISNLISKELTTFTSAEPNNEPPSPSITYQLLNDEYLRIQRETCISMIRIMMMMIINYNNTAPQVRQIINREEILYGKR